MRRTGDSYALWSGLRDWRTGVRRVALTTVEAPPSLTVPSSGYFRQASGPTRSGTFRQNCVSPVSSLSDIVNTWATSVMLPRQRALNVRGDRAKLANGMLCISTVAPLRAHFASQCWAADRFASKLPPRRSTLYPGARGIGEIFRCSWHGPDFPERIRPQSSGKSQ